MKGKFTLSLADLLIILFLIVFVLLKIEHLNLPFFWDELGVYAKGAYYMHDNGISILPAALPPEISRGHPLLYTFLNAIVLEIFGESRIVIHAFNLIICCGLILSVYVVGNRLFGKEVAFLSSLSLMIQPIIFAQSTLVLPEVFLALLFIWTIYFFIEGKYIGYFLTAALACLVKETALVFVGLLSVYKAWERIREGNSLALVFSDFLKYLFPVVSFTVFVIIQKIQNGWFLFPYHTGLFKLDLGQFRLFSTEYIEFVFGQQGRWVWIIGLALSIVWALFIEKNRRSKIYSLMLFSCIGIICFYSLSFYMNRYMIPIMTFSAMIVGYGIKEVIKERALRILVYAAMLLPILHIKGDSDVFDYDEDMGLIQQIDVTKRAISAINNKQLANERIYGNFPALFALHDSRYGYFDTLYPNLVNGENQDPVYYVINVPGSFDNSLPYESWTEILRFGNRSAEAFVYRKKREDN